MIAEVVAWITTHYVQALLLAVGGGIIVSHIIRGLIGISTAKEDTRGSRTLRLRKKGDAEQETFTCSECDTEYDTKQEANDCCNEDEEENEEDNTMSVDLRVIGNDYDETFSFKTREKAEEAAKKIAEADGWANIGDDWINTKNLGLTSLTIIDEDEED